MESLLEVVKILDGIDVAKILNEIMLSKSDEIIEINQNQLDFGIDSKGQVIKTLAAQGSNVYANSTILHRKAKGLQTNKVDLKETGKFWKTFKVKKISKGWQIVADFDLYNTSILDNFNAKYDFLGIIPPFLKDFILNDVFPELKKRVRKKLKI